MKREELKVKSVYKQEGITLIALIITVIVLLILAGVTINLTMGNNGIFQTAQRAAEEHKMGAAKEKLVLAVAEYEVKMRKETMYSILNKIEGLQSIEPNDEQAGVPYNVVVDGYEFLITEELEVIYQGKSNVIVPEIISFSKNVISEEDVKISIQAKTKDTSGIGNLVLIKNGVEIETRKVSGTNVTEEFSLNGNGKYQVKVEGTNKKIVVSEEIEVTEMTRISGTLQAGTVIDGSVLLTVTGEIIEGTISKVEIYDGTVKVKEITYTEPKTQIEEEYQVEYMSFYEEKNYSAKLIANTNKEGNTNIVTTKNVDTIKNETDLRNLAIAVKGGTTFAGNTIKQIGAISLTQNHIAIGTESSPFKGTYDGQGNTISNIKINTSANFQGLFGHIQSATIKNVTLGTGTITGGNRVGGAVGYANNSVIQNVINKGTQVSATTKHQESGIYVIDYARSTATWTLESSSLGGICGKAENTNIVKCQNEATIAKKSTECWVGGIVGYATRDYTGSTYSSITECINKGAIAADNRVAGIVGCLYGNVNVEECSNEQKITGTNDAVGGIVGVGVSKAYVKRCTNTGSINAGSTVGGILGSAFSTTTSTDMAITGCNNLGTITSTSYTSKDYKVSGAAWTGTAALTGGIVGYGEGINIESCYNENNVIATGSSGTVSIGEIISIGGIIGELRNGTVTKSYNTGNILNSIQSNIGGIVGTSVYNSYINNCYNKGNLSAIRAGGIVGCAMHTDIRYCYNKASVTGSQIGGIAGYLGSFEAASYTNNYIYYCYNTGTITPTNSSTEFGGIAGYYDYYDTNYVYSLTNSTTTNWGYVGAYKAGTNQNILNKTQLVSTILSEFGSNFKSDTSNVNDGYPRLSWE